MPESFQTAGYLVLEGLIRLIGALWVFGAVFVWLAVWREGRLDKAVADIEAITRRHLEDAGEPPTEPEVRSSDWAATWADRDDLWRRRSLVLQGGLLLATGLAMGLYHRSAAWLIAVLIAAQGLYFLWRERASRTAPTEADAVAARPNASTVNAGWFSLIVGLLIWTAAALGRLHG